MRRFATRRSGLEVISQAELINDRRSPVRGFDIGLQLKDLGSQELLVRPLDFTNRCLLTRLHLIVTIIGILDRPVGD